MARWGPVMTAEIASEPHPHIPGITRYAIVADTFDDCHAAIQRLMDTVDVAFGGVPGSADFGLPMRAGTQWCAHGVVCLEAVEVA